MKDRRRRNAVVSWSALFWCTLLLVFSTIIFTTLIFSPFITTFSHPFKWIKTTTTNSRATITIRETVILPDQALIFLNIAFLFSLSPARPVTAICDL